MIEIHLLKQCMARVNDVVIITNATSAEQSTHRIVFVNDAFERITGYSRQEAMGQSPRMLQGENTQRSEVKRLRQAILECRSARVELINYAKGGREFWSEIDINPVFDAAGRCTHWISVQRDVTIRKQAEVDMVQLCDRAMESALMKEHFLSTISHEICTPMNGVIGMTDLLLDTPLDPEQLDYVEALNQSGQALMSIINGILDFSKMEAGNVNIESRPFELQRMVDTCLDLVAPKARQKGLSVRCTLDGQIPATLMGDEARIRQVLLVLLGNAVKFTGSGGIALDVRQISFEGDVHRIRFEIRDTGIGIVGADIKRLFQHFQQLDGSITRKHGGIGLGLAISRQLVELMHGQIDVESQAGKGSLFWFELPIVCAVPTPAVCF